MLSRWNTGGAILKQLVWPNISSLFLFDVRLLNATITRAEKHKKSIERILSARIDELREKRAQDQRKENIISMVKTLLPLADGSCSSPSQMIPNRINVRSSC